MDALMLAKILARKNNLHIVPVAEGYVLYRKVPGVRRKTLIGRRGTSDALLELVEKVTKREPAHASG